MPSQVTPIKPTDLIILAVGVVVSALRSPHLIPHQQHRRSLGHEQDRQHILDLAQAQVIHVLISGRPFHPAVPTKVIICSIAVVLSVGLIVFVIVGNQVIERESIVAGNKVDATVWLPIWLLKEIRAPRDTRRQPKDGSRVSLDKAPYVVTKLPIPLRPAVPDERADLVEPSGIPGLSDDLDACQYRV